uniref:Uncharacterized protein n=1 Tax=Schistocephalus solidus TaxID=70667 RepID=A0A0X3NLN4_SCHSO
MAKSCVNSVRVTIMMFSGVHLCSFKGVTNGDLRTCNFRSLSGHGCSCCLNKSYLINFWLISRSPSFFFVLLGWKKDLHVLNQWRDMQIQPVNEHRVTWYVLSMAAEMNIAGLLVFSSAVISQLEQAVLHLAARSSQ